ncbi:MAG: type II toxin-antitoxin system HigB family toxin [Gammaproteobacteria bacterium]|nr:type II toxin-antitoxin system HigB family toxin [Gammaproteobacteria bacterium]
MTPRVRHARQGRPRRARRRSKAAKGGPCPGSTRCVAVGTRLSYATRRRHALLPQLIDYERQGMLIRFVGTHEQYDALEDIEHI